MKKHEFVFYHVFGFTFMLFLSKMHRIDFYIKEGTSVIAVGESLLNTGSYLPDCDLYIITDRNVRYLYEKMFPAGVIMEIEPGEASKTLSVVEGLCVKLVAAGADRHSFILGIGGGVVCDVTGLVASLFMRGVRHGFVSTTLLSQVDASVGGKTGVNAAKYKNVIGTFKLPEFVICDITMLSTLPHEEFISGLGEMIKSAVIADREMFSEIKGKIDLITARDVNVLESLIYRSLQIKTKIVSDDFKESGQRRLLNFGHTIGHPLEMINNVTHGVAVMQGMILAARWSVIRGDLHEKEYLELKSLIDRLMVPPVASLPQGFDELVHGDKKRSGESVSFVFLEEIGKAKIDSVPVKEIIEFMNTLS